MADDSSGQIIGRKKHSFLVNFLIRLWKEKPLGMVGAVITLILLITAIFANLLAPHGMNELFVAPMLTSPSAEAWLGTDNLGRDIFSRVIFGARISVIAGLGAATLAISLSILIGIMCGYLGGKFDLIVQRIVDGWMCFPGLLLLMVLISLIGPGIWQVIIVIGIHSGIGGSRIIRSATMSIRESVYVQAAVAIGCPDYRIIIRHILPNIIAPAIVLFTTRVPGAIITEAGLSFLGFGIPPPFPSWGGMLSGTGRSYMYMAPWMVIWPGLALSIVVYGVNMFGDALRDLLDPRMRGGAGRYRRKAKKDKKERG